MAYARSELVRHVAAGPQAAHRDCAIREAQPGGSEDARAGNHRPVSVSGWRTHSVRAKGVMPLKSSIRHAWGP